MKTQRSYSQFRLRSSMTTQPMSGGRIHSENCKHLFHLIRMHQPLSRSDLSRLSGMPKATVFPIVKQIIRAGWVEEGKPSKIPRGRSPIMLRPSKSLMVCAIALHDRNALLGLVSLEGYVLEQRSVTIPLDLNVAAELLAGELQRLVELRPAYLLYAAGLSATACVHLRDVNGNPCNTLQTVAKIAEHLSLILGVPVEMGSALRGTMLHEMTSRNFDTIRSAVLLHISHDVAGAIWANGEFLSENTGHLGHICVDPKGGVCPCGRRGCLSLYASNEAALAAFHEISGSRHLQRIEELYQMFYDGDPAAIEAVKSQEQGIAAGIRTLTQILDPDLFIVQGACVGIWDHLSKRVSDEIVGVRGAGAPVHLVAAQSGDFDQLKAAAALGWLAIDFVAPHDPGLKTHSAATRSKRNDRSSQSR